MKTLSNQPIEEFLIQKIYQDTATHNPYSLIVEYNPKNKLFTEVLKNSLAESSTEIFHSYLEEIIDTIKTQKDLNKDLFNELLRLYPEYMI